MAADSESIFISGGFSGELPHIRERRQNLWRWADGTDGTTAGRVIATGDSPLEANDTDEGTPMKWGTTGFYGSYFSNYAPINVSSVNKLQWLLWETEAGLELQKGNERVKMAGGMSGQFSAAQLTDEGSVLIVEVVETDLSSNGSRNPSILLWNAVSGDSIGQFSGYSFAGYGDRQHWGVLASVDETEFVVVEIQSGNIMYRVQTPEASIFQHLITSERRMVLESRGCLQVWDLEKNEKIKTIEKTLHFDSIDAVAQSVKNRLVASGGKEGIIIVNDRYDGSHICFLEGHSGQITALAFDPVSGNLVSASEDGTVIIWDVNSREPVATIPIETGKSGIVRLAIHPRARECICLTSEGNAIRVDLAGRTARLIRSLSDVAAVSYSASGKFFSVSNLKGDIRILDSATDESVQTVQHPGEVKKLLFLGNDSQLVSIGEQLAFWDVETGEQFLVLDNPLEKMVDADYNPKSAELIVGGERVMVMKLRELNARLGKMHLEFELKAP